MDQQARENIRDKVLSLLDNAYSSRVHDLGHSIELAEKAISLSRQVNDPWLIAKSLNQLSLFYMIMGRYDASTTMAEEAIGYFKELNDEKGIADARYNLAGIYYKTDNLHLGLIYLIECLITYRKYNDHHNVARVQKSLGTIYEVFGDQKNAVKAYEASIEAAKKAGDKSLKSNVYNPLSGIYLKQGKITEALEMINKSIAMKNEAGDIRGLAFALYGRGKVYTHMGKFAEAEEDYKQALSIHLDAGERLGTAMAYRKLGQLYMAMGAVDKAKETFITALEVSDTYNVAMIRFKSTYHLYEIFRSENDPVKALEYLERYLHQKEAVINTQTLQIIENYELIKQMEMLEKEAQAQKEKAEIIEKKNLAEQASKVKQDFLSTMSHEIRTPLNAVITISSLLKQRADEEDRELLDSLKFAGSNLLRIVNDILDFTKLETGNARIETHKASLHTLVDRIKKTYDTVAREKNLQLLLSVDPAIHGHYEIDDTKITQILGNLLSNAIKYTEAGHIGIKIEKTGGDDEHDRLKFHITDTGAGIEEKDLQKIFDSFTQPQSITTRKQGGSGLGLAIVKKLVELHDSTIHVESSPEGSVFFFELRLKRSGSADQAPAKRLDELKGKTVLLAEDNMVNAMVAIKLLSKWGLVTEHAKNGIEAIERSRNKTFDLILMDIHMPEMNGFDAAGHIRAGDNPNVKTPIFAFTADITAEQQQEYHTYFNGFLRKPIEIDKLYDTLNLTG